jgi:hypothetical protein
LARDAGGARFGPTRMFEKVWRGKQDLDLQIKKLRNIPIGKEGLPSGIQRLLALAGEQERRKR